jgi:hypothetical protein
MSNAAHATATGYTWEDATDRLESTLEQIRTGTTAEVPRTRLRREASV